MIKSPNFKKTESFTLIEVLVGTFLILIVFLGIFAAYQLGLKVVGQSKNKITATAIANGEIEKVRNLPYESIGIIGGFPEGDLESIKTTTINNIEYTIETRVDYVVDSADGISAPEDECPNDYKRMEVKISWSGLLGGEVKLITDVSPENLAQECAETGGILLISVFDAYGTMVTSPLIEIKIPATGEVVKTATPIEGKHFFSLAPATYKVVISKTNYSSERTYGIEEITTPEKPHLIVLEGELTESSFSIDKVSSFSVDTLSLLDEEEVPIPNAFFHLQGGKIIGTDENEGPVYKYSQGHVSGGDGHIDISNLEWDNYAFSTDPATGLDLESTEPSPQPIGLSPDTFQKPVKLYLTAQNSLLVTVQDLNTAEPIFSAAVRLYTLDLTYDNTQYTDGGGRTYFIPLESTDYTMEIEAAGYVGYSGIVSVLGDTTKIINLERIE